MSVTLTGTGGLFTRLGKLSKVLYDAHGYAGGSLTTNVNAAIAALGTEYGLQSPLPAALTAGQSAVGQTPGSTLRAVAQATLLKMVNDDAPQANSQSLSLAIQELIRQMVGAGASVAACTVGVTPAAVSGNSGTGVIVSTTKNGTGLINQNIFAETGDLIVTGDGQSVTATAGSEPWIYRGDYAVSDVLSYQWPGYSGAQAGLTTCDSQSRGVNLLTNGGLETFTTTDIPDNWALLTGAATTDYAREGTTVHRGTYSYKFIGGGSIAHSIAQTFTSGTILPNTVYAYNLKVRANATLGSGNLVVKLIDGSNSTITDDQSSANGSSTTLSGVSTGAWDNVQGILITPRVLPSTVKLNLVLSAAQASGKHLFVDSIALCPITYLYAGGPGLAAFAGSTPWVVNDRYTVATTNNRNSATYGATWQTTFDRWFGMRSLGLQLPYSGSPTIADSLITS